MTPLAPEITQPRAPDQTLRDIFAREMAERGVPEHLRAGLLNWIMDATPTGSFLHAVLRGDLFEAVLGGSPESLSALPAVVKFLAWDAPYACAGSPERVRAWRGLNHEVTR